MKSLFSVAGKTVLITGGSRGIGAMLAEGFVRSGATVFISARKARELEECRARLAKLGDCRSLIADMSTTAGVQALVDAVTQHTDTLDVLINNAGASWGAPLDQFPESGWDKVMNLNLKSLFFLSQQLLPLLRRAARPEAYASIINISSVYALMHSPLNTYSYSASKAAVIALTRQLAADLQADHIKVNAIAPGYFPSAMTAPLDEQAMVAEIPAGRMGRLEDIAGTAIYLASTASDYMTGRTLALDGGILASR
ncbi:SDR family oxidoreductase [Spongiibacter tropicus]|uniref:SDR family oxidoreductase n=1 Tax=Spongiibacter tropicus TaxID=454602 RepID=UPI0003B6A252|nr:SDR family oxidoreductase [Spongiibacter tropicus]